MTVTVNDFFRRLKEMKLSLGEFSHLNAMSQMILEAPAFEEENHQQKEEQRMPKIASKDRVTSVDVNMVAVAHDMATKLNANGFQPLTAEFTGDGQVASITCTKSEKTQVVTTEIFDAIVGD